MTQRACGKGVILPLPTEEAVMDELRSLQRPRRGIRLLQALVLAYAVACVATALASMGG